MVIYELLGNGHSQSIQGDRRCSQLRHHLGLWLGRSRRYRSAVRACKQRPLRRRKTDCLFLNRPARPA
jgi:hypothetical protein